MDDTNWTFGRQEHGGEDYVDNKFLKLCKELPPKPHWTLTFMSIQIVEFEILYPSLTRNSSRNLDIEETKIRRQNPRVGSTPPGSFLNEPLDNSSFASNYRPQDEFRSSIGNAASLKRLD